MEILDGEKRRESICGDCEYKGTCGYKNLITAVVYRCPLFKLKRGGDDANKGN